jgi:hypothetical protein
MFAITISPVQPTVDEKWNLNRQKINATIKTRKYIKNIARRHLFAVSICPADQNAADPAFEMVLPGKTIAG